MALSYDQPSMTGCTLRHQTAALGVSLTAGPKRGEEGLIADFAYVLGPDVFASNLKKI